jgi:hypothetical protein
MYCIAKSDDSHLFFAICKRLYIDEIVGIETFGTRLRLDDGDINVKCSSGLTSHGSTFSTHRLLTARNYFH